MNIAIFRQRLNENIFSDLHNSFTKEVLINGQYKIHNVYG